MDEQLRMQTAAVKGHLGAREGQRVAGLHSLRADSALTGIQQAGRLCGEAVKCSKK